MKKTIILTLFIALLGLTSCSHLKKDAKLELKNNIVTTESIKTPVKDVIDTVKEEVLEDNTKESEENLGKESEENIVKQVEKQVEKKEVITKTKGVYMDYLPSIMANAKGDIVLFFHASWCPSCKSANESLKGSTIPDGLTILKLDYDSENELKAKYGITYQHTFVQVDSSGNMISKWSGSRNVDEIVRKLK